MKNTIEKLLLAKGIKASEEELQALMYQWQAIQQLKGDFKSARLKDYDIGVIHQAGGVYDE